MKPRTRSSTAAFDSAVPTAQGLYYLLTGLWPLLHVGSFQQVTGPKVDVWLVKTVGVLIGVIGAVLASAGSVAQ